MGTRGIKEVKLILNSDKEKKRCLGRVRDASILFVKVIDNS